jgi:hypothetical protein
MKMQDTRIIENFSAWRESRELNRLVNSSICNLTSGNNPISDRNSLAYLSESIMSETAVIFEKIRTDTGLRNIEGTIEKTAMMKSRLYCLFDTGHIQKEVFSEVLIRLNRVRVELETIRKKLEKRANKNKASRESPSSELKDRK